MLSCSHHFGGPRLNGLSTPCRTSGRWNRSLRINGHGTQRVSTYNSLNQGSSLDHHDFTTSTQLEAPRASLLSAVLKPDLQVPVRSPQPQSTDIETDKQATTSHEPPNPNGVSNRTRRPVRPLSKISKTEVRSLLHHNGLNPSLAEHVTRRTNNELAALDKPLAARSVRMAAVLRAKSLFSRELALRQWKAAYAAIFYAKLEQRDVENRAVIPKLTKDGQEILEKLQSQNSQAFGKIWHAMDRSIKASLWQRLAISLLEKDPQLLLKFLFATTQGETKPDFTMVVDCLLFLDRFYYKTWLKDHTVDGRHNYSDVIQACLHPTTWPIISLPHKGARLFIRRARLEAVVSAFLTVNRRGIHMTATTMLCFMWRFTELGDVDYALRALHKVRGMNEASFSMNSEGVHRHCCKLLTLDKVEDTQSGRNFQILPRLLEMGVRPDRDMMNVVVANAFKTGDPQLGADMLDFMKQHGFEYDSHTYMTLLKHAVECGDRGKVDALMHQFDAHDELRNNPWLVSKIMHCHYIYTVKHLDTDADPRRMFYSMLEMYNRFHDITPLRELFIIPRNYTVPGTGEIKKTLPSPVALYIMIATYFRCQERFDMVQRVYSQFRSLVVQGHPVITPLAETDHTYNEFLLAFRESPRGLQPCMRVVEDMLNPPTFAADSLGTSKAHSKPTIRTWTILLSAFIFHRRPRAAERIREMMTKHNVRFNNVTWNTIISGYVTAQDIPKTAATIWEMEQQGFSIDQDPCTMRSLRYLRDPERLSVAIEELDRKTTEAGLDSHVENHIYENVDGEEIIEHEPEFTVHNNNKKRDQLVDWGLEKLGTKMKPRL
ncbi:hypothetical protein N7495_005532 [Penicillium taxi]|uniref:uncharacterized protein n=1 Tax=Penicillium taxi TaxID=168475 RepID=UPI00254581D7|nr:uncharacterized protein N7495_005532 [Penicillium taxi]KAJ5893841.1 hypothetical protein N7495_005532 [Penicillium taxi]